MINQDEIIKALGKKTKSGQCLHCGGNNWYTIEDIFSLVSMDGFKNHTKGDGFYSLPLVQIQCLDCGNVLLFNPKALGVQYTK